jgi:hypothetical protein
MPRCDKILAGSAMKTICLTLLAAAALLAQPAPEPGFVPLFDGKTLDGWDGDTRFWKVVDGAIQGSTDETPTKGNTFLIYRKKEFGDFILRAQVKLRNHNSGIQFRSEALDNWVVRGYQADMAQNNWWGGVYEEKGTRGVMVNGWKGKAEKVVKDNDWNDVEIFCQGDLIRININGLDTAELRDSVRLKGVIALQLHAGPPMAVWFRNIRIKELP